MVSAPVSPFQGPLDNIPVPPHPPATVHGIQLVLKELWDLYLWVASGYIAVPFPGGQKLLLARVVFLS